MPDTDMPTPAPQYLVIGQKMADGSIYAGLTPDGDQQIFAMAEDLSQKFRFQKYLTMTFNQASGIVEKLNTENAFGHNDWHIPSLRNLHVLRLNQNEGALKGTFNATNEIFNDSLNGWYWSSTSDGKFQGTRDNVRFTDGKEYHTHEDTDLLRCRLIRLVPVKA
jgi:hypothetical protein